MLLLTRPSSETIRQFITAQCEKSFSYVEAGASRSVLPKGYVIDRRRICLGEGEYTFVAAREALRCWEMFNLGWVQLCWPEAPVAAGSTVAVLAHVFGVWWLVAARIVYVIDEPRRFGFAYGTLPDHLERGEERFMIEWREDDSVSYDLLAFSRPKHWLVKLGYPATRLMQKRFGKNSLEAMARATRNLVWAKIREIRETSQYEKLPVHKIVLKIEADYLDTSNVVEIDKGYERYLAQIQHPSRLPIDFGRVTYISDVFGILIYSMNRPFYHQLLLMNLAPAIKEALELMDFLKLPQFKVIPDGLCPVCGKSYAAKEYCCEDCGNLQFSTTP